MFCTYAGLGNTVSEIDVSNAKVFSKTVFSMVIPEVEEVLTKDPNRKSVVLFGIEVCDAVVMCMTHTDSTVVLTLFMSFFVSVILSLPSM